MLLSEPVSCALLLSSQHLEDVRMIADCAWALVNYDDEAIETGMKAKMGAERGETAQPS